MNKKTKFTASEVEILQLVADGFTNAEIARLLSLNENSVNEYCRRLKQKTGAKDTPDLVRITLQAGYLNEFPAELKKHYSVSAGQRSEQTVAQNTIQRSFSNNLSQILKFFSYDDLLRKTIIFLGTCVMLLGAIMARSESVNPVATVDISVQELRVDLRSLLEEHVALTRAVIFCIVDERPGIDSIVHEVVKNQETTSALIKRYYGDEAGKQFTKLLYKNITLAADVMIACRKAHSGAYDKADKKWKESADEIVAFLTQANPSYKMFGIKKLLDDEMKYTADEMKAIKNNDDTGCDEAFDRARSAALAIADTLSETIVQHFPERFHDGLMTPASYGVK